MPDRTRSAAAALLLGLLSACGPHRHYASPPAEVVFSNQSVDLADVYAVGASGETMRIGTVASNRTETLKVPSSMIGGGGTVNIVARLLARSVRPQTGQFALRAGERVSVTLPAAENILVVLPAQEP